MKEVKKLGLVWGGSSMHPNSRIKLRCQSYGTIIPDTRDVPSCRCVRIFDNGHIPNDVAARLNAVDGAAVNFELASDFAIEVE